MTNSRIHLLSDTLHAHPELTAVGFNDLEKNLKALKDGSVDFLVTHGIEAQAKLTIHLIADYLVKGIDPQPREHFIHLDILHRLNFD
jgi:ABC-type sugar transport system substrate-binding protein